MRLKITLVVLILYTLIHVCFYSFLAFSYMELREDPSMGAFSYALQVAQKVNTFQAIIFTVPIFAFVFKRRYFPISLISTIIACAIGSFYSEFITFKNAGALSLTEVNVIDTLSYIQLRFVIEPLILFFILFKVKYINKYFCQFSVKAS
ncbi:MULTISPECIES: hypothetical protein [unclassified Colwellia]|uniref:hypothetical protein n=1 Tax=unclassified Colwellia TaxID=196834 RepID=UPI0015F4CAA7|nr:MULTISPECIES: hypothetical protein [unclassified Colwellia]MBA6231369.1 hypothetical protein [Colwellia sp. MB02u-7]MBA6235978.1 hypothetical protein [Colwellia sp. MB02u-11]MBA6297935.1 hypothetical protein [Colwellia sp. MB3u-22]MBA6309440.1 hypothetical protein [Colwellia sp. MB3u-64]